MANMMKVTVKTLDSCNHNFEVDTEATVQQLKHQIRDSLGLEIESQRLIFSGRVLQDEQKLRACGVNDGKCLHLVQRPPPSPPSRRRDRVRDVNVDREQSRRDAMRRRPGGSPLSHHIRHLLANPPDLAFEQHQHMSMTPTNGRMEFIRRMITEIRESMETLRIQAQELGLVGITRPPEYEPMDIDSDHNEPQADNEGLDNEDDDNDGENGVGARSRRSRARANRLRYSRPRDLGQLLEELDLLHEVFALYRTQYIVALRDLTYVQYLEPERQLRQRTMTLICDIMHSFAHAYHAVSDITFHVGQRYPRLTSEPPSATRYPRPMQAQINVVTTTGRRSRSGDGRAGRAAGNTRTPAPAPAPPAPAPPAPAPPAPAPPAASTTAAPSAPTATATGPPPAVAGPILTDEDGSDLEALLRSLSQAGGVEVLMSMDELPGFMQGLDGNNEHGVYVTPLLAGSGGPQHTAEIFHNLIANVVRQNAGAPVLLQGHRISGPLGPHQGRSQTQGQNQQSTTAQRQTAQGQTTSQTGPERTTQEQTTNEEPTANQGQANPGQGANQGQNQQNRNAGRRQWQAPRAATRQHSNDRVHNLMMSCMVYDRYMNCDSQFARRHLQDRRAHYQRQAEDQERTRSSRAPAPVLELLMGRNRRFLPRHMEVMMRLLGGPVCEEGQINAFMITIARHLFLDPMSENPNDPSPAPSEFPFIRMQLREYIQGLLETAIETGGRTNTFEAVTERVILQNLDFLRSIPREHVPLMVDLAMLDDGFTGDNAFDPIADYFVERHSDFLRNMHLFTSVNNDIDAVASVRVMTRSRLPAIIACVMSEASSDMFAARFYSVFARFFTDMCTLFLCFCTEGFDGLLILYNRFISGITAGYEPGVREWLRTVSRENLFAIQDSLEPNIETTARQYFRRADGSMPPPAESPRRAPSASTGTARDTARDDSPPLEEDAEIERSVTPFLHSVVLPRVDGDSSSSMSSELRSPDELNTRSESGSPRPFRGWDTSSGAEPRSVDIDTAQLPGGIITIGLGSSSDSSLYDPDENNDDFIDTEGPDDYEFTEMQRTLLDRQLNLLEDEENLQVDVENDDGVPVHLLGRTRRPDPYVALSQAAIRMDLTRLRGQALRRGRTDPTAFAMRQLGLRMDQRTENLSASEREADAQMLIALEHLQRIADRQTDRPPSPPAPPAPRAELISDSAPPPDRSEPGSEYSTPPVNTQLEEPEFLEPNAPNHDGAPTIHPIYHIDMTEPEYLVPINNLRNRLNSCPRNDDDRSSPDADRLIINEDVITEDVIAEEVMNEDVDYFSYSDCDTRANESGENSGYLTPFARNRDVVDSSLLMLRCDSNESMPEAPRVEEDNNDGKGESSTMELAMSQVETQKDNASPPPGASSQQAMTPDLENQQSRPQSSQCLSEGKDDAQTNQSTVPESETKIENLDSKCSNEDAANASAQTPMESVFEHFESNWAPVLREDEAAQALPTRPQEPFSDAYLAGMPSRKRRCVRESRSDPSLDGLMSEGVGATGVTDVSTDELREFLRESFRSLVRNRTQREPENFSISQFQNTATFIDIDKPTKEEEEESAAAAAVEAVMAATSEASTAPSEAPPDNAE